MNKDRDIYKVALWAVTITCIVLVGIIYTQYTHILYLEELVNKYVK